MGPSRRLPARPHRSLRPGGRTGQASLEYVAVLAVVALLAGVGTAAAAGTSPPALAAQLASSLRHGICVAAGGVCSPGQARRAGLGPCAVHVRRDAETTGALVALVRLRRGDSLQLIRRSDGTAAVAFLDGHEAGAEYGIGLQLPWTGPKARATGAAGVSFQTGRAYEFASWSDAQRFLRRYAARETTAGEALDAARGLSPVHEPRAMPRPRAVSYESGTWSQLRAEAQLPAPGTTTVEVDAEARMGRVLGRRVSGRESTWYVRLESQAGARLGLLAGALGAGAGSDTVLEVTVRDGRATSMAITGSAQIDGDLGLYGHTTDLGTLADRLRRASARGAARGSGRGGLGLEGAISLDLTAPANRAAAERVFELVRGRVAPADWDDALRALGDRLDRGGSIDLSVYRISSSERDSSLSLAGGAGVGIERVTSRQTRELVEAWSVRGGAVQAREDCVAAA